MSSETDKNDSAQELKKLILFIFIAVIGLGSYLYLHFAKKPSMITPYPYYFTHKTNPPKNIETAHILVVGDRMGYSLSAYNEAITEHLSQGQAKAIQLVNWSSKKEILARTVYKLKSLKKLPPIVIYHGATEEFLEKRFHLNDFYKIKENFEKYEQKKWSSLLYLNSWVSKILYKEFRPLELTKKYTALKIPAKEGHFFKMVELTYKIFEWEMRDLIKTVGERNSKLIILPTPLNLEIPPEKICEVAQVKETEEGLFAAQELYNKGDYKGTLNLLGKIKDVSAHAGHYYLLGQTYQAMGQIQKAIPALEKVSVFDCLPWRGNKVFNNIIRRQAKKYGVSLVDFEALINRDLGQDILFEDKLYPQHIYYQKALSLVMNKIKDQLQL